MIDYNQYYSQKSIEWATPIKFFNDLNKEFNFTLDPCSTDENAKCEKHYTIKENGLIQDWGGRESSAIHLMEKNFLNGWRNATRRV